LVKIPFSLDDLAELAGAAIEARPGRLSEDCVYLDRPLPPEAIPGLAEGRVSVQDESAQLAVALLAAVPGERVLDACAAPGGKTAHLLEAGADAVTAVDVDARRLRRVGENLTRLGLAAELVAGDAARPETWWDGRPFERILLDVPCSGTGVIRRHPDIKYLRRDADIPALAEAQAALLEAAWRMLAPGGRLLYATCSVLKDENETVVSGFLAGRKDAEVLPVAIAGGPSAGVGRQLLPDADGGDGFYYACMTRKSP
jgi:16S rRNA (cytosine967-C5)-methyltransferase